MFIVGDTVAFRLSYLGRNHNQTERNQRGTIIKIGNLFNDPACDKFATVEWVSPTFGAVCGSCMLDVLIRADLAHTEVLP
jgi:hypothetical protein